MIANFVVFQTKPGQRDAFVAASMANSRGSIEGEGCVATSIIADPRREDVSYVFEVFVDEQAFEEHHRQPYYKEWLAAIQDMLAAPYQLLQSTTFPDDASFRHLRLAVAGGEDPSGWT